jgi:hypothetical protein
MPRTYTEWALLILALIALLCGVFSAVNDGTSSFLALILSVGIIALTSLIAFISFEPNKIPANPPSVAMPTIMGRRYDVIIREGWVFVCPGIEDLIVRDYVPVVLPFVFDGIRCLLTKTDTGEKISGGLVTIKGSITYLPDYTEPGRFRSFLNKGGHPVVSEQVLAMLGQAVREDGANRTWEELTFAKAVLSAELITMLTGLEPVNQEPDTIKNFLAQALVNGVADIKDLGIKITRLNVEEVGLEGKLKEDAERAARELVQRSAELTDTDTALKIMNAFLMAMNINASELQTMPLEARIKLFEKILEWVRIDRGRADEIVIRSSGNPLADAAALLRPPTPSKTSVGDSNT